jgi:hypothetical protein
MLREKIYSTSEILLNFSYFAFMVCLCFLLVHLIMEADRRHVREAAARHMCKPSEGQLVKELGEDGNYFCYTRNKDGKTFSRAVLLTGE